MPVFLNYGQDEIGMSLRLDVTAKPPTDLVELLYVTSQVFFLLFSQLEDVL